MALRLDVPILPYGKGGGLTGIVGLVVGNLVEVKGGDRRTGEVGGRSWELVEDSHAAVLDLGNTT